MAQKMLNQLSGTSSREEESQWLDIVALQAGDQSHMSSFFSKGLLGWIHQQMKDDFSCDIIEHMTGAAKQAQREYEDLHKSLFTLQGVNSKLDADIMVLKSALAKSNKMVEDKHLELSEEKNVSSRLQETVEEQIEMLDDLRDAVEVRDQEIMKLKAMIFDLTIGKGK
jgi:hypothetical protein